MIKKAAGVLAAAVMMSGLFLGCEGDGGGGGNEGGSSSFVGTWALYLGSSIQGDPWYVHFQSDGTFFISNQQDGTTVRVSGTYTVSDGALTGPFTNPGVGDGRVEATIANDLMSLDFIEYLHTPNKVGHYTGTKM
jgi:hypothetical protein